MVQCCFVLSWVSVRIFQAENSKARDVIPEWQTVNPTKGQGESLGVMYRMERTRRRLQEEWLLS